MSEIVLEDVFFSYQKNPVLENVSFSVEKGSINAIIGPNGGGKTTLLKLLLGLIDPVSGKILLKGSSPKKIREKIGYVPQSNITDPFFPITLYKTILLGCLEKAGLFSTYPKEIKERADYLLETLGLHEHRNKPFGALSGGLKQRTLIARALLSDPEFLFLDEATASIDPENQEKIFSLIASFKGKKTVMMVTHNLDAVFNSVDRVFSCQRKVSSYSPDQVCKHFTFGLYHTPLKEEKK